ncbi:diguanylate cyclase [Actinomycetes bacterium M1A6_2h]
MSFRKWLNQPFDYDWAVRYLHDRRSLTRYRYIVALWALADGVAALTALPGAVAPADSFVRNAVVGALAVACCGIAVAWVRGPWPSQRVSTIFVVFADVGVAAVMLSVQNAYDGMPGIALYAVTGVYVTAFHGPRLILAHLGIATTAAAVMFGLVAAQGDTSMWSATSRLFCVYPVVLAVPLLLRGLLANLQHDAIGSFRDPLTGLRNRRGLHAAAVDLLDVPEDDAHLSVLVLDIDDFKAINDTHGHARGDEVLRLMADRIALICGEAAVVARTGGEEFAIVIRADQVEAGALADTLLGVVSRSEDETPITVSLGIAFSSDVRRADIRAITDLIDKADSAMYAAKSRGGNSTFIAR